MAYLYRHIRLDKNEPFYVGIATHLKRAYDKSSRKNKIWKSIIAKTDYEVQILFDDLTREEALEKEKEFISLYGRIDLKNGTLANHTDGGEDFNGLWNKGRKASEETRAKQREAAKHKPPMSEETKKKISNSHKGRVVSQETKRKLSLINIGTKKDPWNEERRLKIEKSWKSKIEKIVQYDLEMNLIKIWDNRIIASEELNIKKDWIRNCLRGKMKSANKFIFSYLIPT
jgi:hypothetical protein